MSSSSSAWVLISSLIWSCSTTAYIQSTYYSSYVYVVSRKISARRKALFGADRLLLGLLIAQIKDWSTKNYTFFLSTLGVSLCAFGLLAGAVQRITHGYKYPQLFGIGVRAM